MDVVREWMRVVHIAAGFVGLAAFWVPVVARKGGRWHRGAGRVFTACATVVGVTAVVSATYAVVDPVAFLRVRAEVSPERLARAVDATRTLGVFLGMLGVAMLTSLRFAHRALALRHDPRALDEPIGIALHAASGVLGAVTLAMGIASGHPLVAGFSLVGLVTAADFARIRRRPLPTPMSWWYHHMGGMLGCGIAFHTAFLVFGGARLFGISFDSAWAAVPWLVPSAVGIPATALWVRAYQRRFGELRPTAVSEAVAGTS